MTELRLLVRSRSRGVQVLGSDLEETDFAALEKRNVFALSEKWLAVGGGGAPVEILSLVDDRKTTLASDTSDAERFVFSPLASYLITWQRPDAKRFPDGSMRVWSTASGQVVTALHCKQLKSGIEGTLAFSGDERVVMHAVTNTLKVYDAHFEALDSIRCQDVASFSLSPCAEPPYGAALFVPELKGKPASVHVVAYPSTDEVCRKSFYRAQEAEFKWSPAGHGVLVQTHTDVDATGGSYYGGTGLYLMHGRATKPGEPALECLVPLPKEGPIADAQWEPSKGREFVVIAGTVPPVAVLYNLDAQPIHNFGAAHRNVVAWSPHGRFLALCGFGNLAGDVDFWDRHKKKKIGSCNIPCAVAYGWAPDSRRFMSATLAPRMNVDNCVRLYRYDGSGPVAVKDDLAPLFDCAWIPADASQFPDRPASPASKDRAKLLQASDAAPPAAYVPPSARGRGSTLAAQLRAERQGQLGGAGKPSQASTFGGPKSIPGMAPAVPESRNKKRRDAQKKRKEAAEAEAQLTPPPPPQPAPAEPEPVGPLTKEDLLKKQKGLKKKLKAVAELQAKVDGGLAPSADQRDKLDRAKALDAELADVERKLRELD